MRGSRETADPRTAAHPLHAVALVCAIATPLVLAAWLEREPSSVTPPIASAAALSVPAPAPTAALDAPVPEPPTTEPPDAPAPVDLSQRARADSRRLRDAGRFTLQFGVMCRDDNVREILAELDSDPLLFVVAASIEGRPCHRVLYGAYRSAEAAADERAVPRALRSLTTAPRAVSVTQVAP